MAQLAARLFQRLQSAVQMARLRRVGQDEKAAVVALLQEVALSDGLLSPEEDAAINNVAVALETDRRKLPALPEAVAILGKKPSALRLACLLMADAFFVDGDYDAREKAFVASFGERLGLGENPLKDAVESLRRKKLDQALASWNEEIEGD